MAEFFVSYDLESASSSRHLATATVFSAMNADKVLSRTWRVNWTSTKEQLADRVEGYLAPGDKLLVIEPREYVLRDVS